MLGEALAVDDQVGLFSSEQFKVGLAVGSDVGDGRVVLVGLDGCRNQGDGGCNQVDIPGLENLKGAVIGCGDLLRGTVTVTSP